MESSGLYFTVRPRRRGKRRAVTKRKEKQPLQQNLDANSKNCYEIIQEMNLVVLCFHPRQRVVQYRMMMTGYNRKDGNFKPIL